MKLFELIKNELNIELTEIQIQQFDMFYNELIEYNKKTNLTRITDRNEVDIKHFLDSLLLAKSFDLNKQISLCDLGTGAGFPGIPLKIVFPNMRLVLVDSLGKRIKFLEKIIKDLKLENVSIINCRAEEYALENQNKYDVVVSRAFSKLRIFLEIAMPLTKIGGYIIAMKGANYKEEVLDCKGLLNVFHSKVIDEKKIVLPQKMGTRTNIKIQKNSHVQGYPRKYAMILKSEVKG